MSFTPPSTVASQANTGYLAQFLLKYGSPLAFTAVSEVKSFSMDPISMPQVENTHLLSPGNTQEFVPGMINPGKVTFEGNFIGDDTQLAIGILSRAQTIFDFQVKAPVQRNTKTYTATAQAFVTSFKLGPFENNKPLGFSAELQITGVISETVA